LCISGRFTGPVQGAAALGLKLLELRKAAQARIHQRFFSELGERFGTRDRAQWRVRTPLSLPFIDLALVLQPLLVSGHDAAFR
jgi:hypothetical protein